MLPFYQLYRIEQSIVVEWGFISWSYSWLSWSHLAYKNDHNWQPNQLCHLGCDLFKVFLIYHLDWSHVWRFIWTELNTWTGLNIVPHPKVAHHQGHKFVKNTLHFQVIFGINWYYTSSAWLLGHFYQPQQTKFKFLWCN